MTARPWLSVVMPLHDGAEWIEATLASLAQQDTAGIEIIAIDSSADERTAESAGGFTDRLDLTLLRRPDAPSWTEKTNLAVQLAKADHVVMLHQDDLWLPGRADAVRCWIETAPDACVHLAPTAILDRNGRTLGRWRCPLRSGEVPAETLLERLIVQNFVSVPAPVIRRDAWLRAGGLDPDLWYTADWDLWLKLGALGPVYYHDEVTTGFRIHGGSLTMSGSRSADAFRAQMQTVLDRHIPQGRSRKLAEASISINCALAAIAGGGPLAILRLLGTLARLGPSGIGRYIAFSRILERSLPRLRAAFAGGL